MGRYFGTDGIRGKANEDLDAQRAFTVGRFLGSYYSKEGKKKIIIGKDTRLSSDMFESALAAGIASGGCDAYLTGYCPTPMICYLTVHEDFAVGAMISASHNPFYDNGIKIFSKEGVKLQGKVEELIEDYIDGIGEAPFAVNDKIGRVVSYPEGRVHYLAWLKEAFPLDLSGVRILADTANGSSCFTAPEALRALGADVTVLNHEPDGLNINTHCGSTHPEMAQEAMKKGKYDLGLTFDGDADRQILIRPDGELVNGDFVLYICGKYYKSKGLLRNNTVVSTVMANLGLFKAMERENIRVAQTQVGDKYVYDQMCREDDLVGGEQSGHIIFRQYETTGDGLVTALEMLRIMLDTGKGISELCEGLRVYPQLLENVHVKDKKIVMDDPDVQAAIDEVNADLAGNGRLLVRPSGTEPLLRVMAEAETEEICAVEVHKVTKVIEEKFGL